MFESLKGHFLIAGPGLRDPNFFKTAVLMLDHTPDGAMGLVVNRPSSISVANALSGQFELPAADDLVYVGGPVEPAALFILHDGRDMDVGLDPITPGLFVASSAQAFEAVMAAVAAAQPVKYRVYSGCAGWGPRQLDDELARGDWRSTLATSDVVFHADPYRVWDQLIQEAAQAARPLSLNSPHPDWN